jgi:hypothetical protein
MGVLLFPRPSRLSDHVGISQSICTHFAMAGHCPHIVLKVFDFSSWYTFRPQKTDQGTPSFLGANGEWRSHFIVSQRKAKLW